MCSSDLVRLGDVTDFIDVGRWPRNLALSPDGSRLAIGDPNGPVALVEVSSGKVLVTQPRHTARGCPAKPDSQLPLHPL